MNTTTISLPPTLELKLDLTDEQFWQLCHDNSDLRFERTATGKLIIMSPTGSQGYFILNYNILCIDEDTSFQPSIIQVWDA